MSTITCKATRNGVPVDRALLEDVLRSPSLEQFAPFIEISEIFESSIPPFGKRYNTFGIRIDDSDLEPLLPGANLTGRLEWLAREFYTQLNARDVDITPTLLLRQSAFVEGERFESNRELSFRAAPFSPFQPNAFPALKHG